MPNLIPVLFFSHVYRMFFKEIWLFWLEVRALPGPPFLPKLEGAGLGQRPWRLTTCLVASAI